MAVERFYSGDPLSASKFNRLVATICNLQRKVNELKRRPKSLLLRNASFARYPHSATCGCGCGFVSCFCYKPCVGVFPIYKPPFSMHWKMSEWECNGRYYSTETTTLVVNRGSWFKGSKRVDFPTMVFDHAASGEYFADWCSGAIVRGVRNDTGLLPKGMFPIGCVLSELILVKWSGDIWQPPDDCSIYVQAFTDYERFWSNQIYEDCKANICTKGCVFRPVRAEFAGTNVSSVPCACSYLSLAGNVSTPDARWIHGSQRAGLETNLPTLCVNIHGRCSSSPLSCRGWWYSGNPVYVCKKCLRGYTYGISPDGTASGVFGYSRINDYTGEHYACRWIDTPLLPVQNVLSVWTSSVSRGGACACGYGVGSWQPDRCVLVRECGNTETRGSSEASSWKFVNYIADIVACKKDTASVVYSVPKKQSVSETYYTGENCNGN